MYQHVSLGINSRNAETIHSIDSSHLVLLSKTIDSKIIISIVLDFDSFQQELLEKELKT